MASDNHVIMKRALRRACEFLGSEIDVADACNSRAKIACWRNPDHPSLPDVTEAALIDAACIAQSQGAPFFESFTALAETSSDQRPIRSVALVRETLELQRRVAALATALFEATGTDSKIGEDIGPGERRSLDRQVAEIVDASLRLQLMTRNVEA